MSEETFESILEAYLELRKKLLPILTSRLPDDPAQVWEQRSQLEEYGFLVAEAEADFEGLFLTAAAREYEKESCGAWDYAVALQADKKKWAKKAKAAVLAIESRSIKLSQNRKLSEGNH